MRLVSGTAFENITVLPSAETLNSFQHRRTEFNVWNESKK